MFFYPIITFSWYIQYKTVQKAADHTNLCSYRCEGFADQTNFLSLQEILICWMNYLCYQSITLTHCSYPSLLKAAVFEALKKRKTLLYAGCVRTKRHNHWTHHCMTSVCTDTWTVTWKETRLQTFTTLWMFTDLNIYLHLICQEISSWEDQGHRYLHPQIVAGGPAHTDKYNVRRVNVFICKYLQTNPAYTFAHAVHVMNSKNS